MNSYFRQKSLSLNLSIWEGSGRASRKNHKFLWQKVPETWRSSAYITKWLHNSLMLCNAMSDVLLEEKRKRERDRGNSICANIRNANQCDNSWDQLKKPDTFENALRTYWKIIRRSKREKETCEKCQSHS